MFDGQRLMSNISSVRRMNIAKTKNFFVSVAVHLYKVVAGKMGVNSAEKQVCTAVDTTFTTTTATTTPLRGRLLRRLVHGKF
jgi:hypothetical protein